MVGGTGFLIDAGITLLLIQIGLDPTFSRIPAICIAALFTWLANRYFTYEIKTSRTTNEAIRYAVVASTMAFLNYTIYLILIQIGLLPVISIIIATALQTIISFHAYRHFVFKSPSV